MHPCPALLETGCEILGAKYSLSSVTTVEAPFSFATRARTTTVKALNSSQWENIAASITMMLRAEYHKGKCMHVLESVTSQN